jgi:hypothetical protein
MSGDQAMSVTDPGGRKQVKRATRAALISGLVFPGLGHLYLRKYLVGLILLGLAGWSLFSIATGIYATALAVVSEIESSGMAIDSASVSQLIAERAEQAARSSRIPTWVLLACWLTGIVDSARIGRAQERLNIPPDHSAAS